MSPYLLTLVLHTALVLLPERCCAKQTTLRCEQCEEALGGCWDEHKRSDDEVFENAEIVSREIHAFIFAAQIQYHGPAIQGKCMHKNLLHQYIF